MNTNISPKIIAAARPRRSFRALWLVLLLVGITGVLLWRGIGFYRCSLDARIDHRDFRVLSPGGLIGHGYGTLGTAVIFTNLLYLARRRLAWLPIGSMARWLDLHVVTGLVGSLLVVFHSAFQLRTPIATITAVSLGVVVVTGVVGRYIYALTPRAGQIELQQRLAEMDTTLPSFAKAARAALDAHPCTRIPANAGLLRVLSVMPRWWLESRARRRALHRAARHDPELSAMRTTEPRIVRRLVHEIAQLGAAEVATFAGGALLRTWRSLHRFTAIVMVISVTIHVVVAWLYGYRWVFSR